MKKALITGVNGQDGRFLCRLLMNRSYRVTGTTRNIHELSGDSFFSSLGVQLKELDLTNQSAIDTLIKKLEPDEVYNFAAYAVGSTTWETPVSLANVNALAVLRILESIHHHSPRTRFFQASSSEVFGSPETTPQSEHTAMIPENPYGAAKLYAQSLVRMYRERYNLHACSAIFFNHESHLRSPEFVSRKVTLGAARISLGIENSLKIGNLDSRRDWGFAGDYVEAAWKMLQCEAADDYIVATGISHSVRDLCEIAFSHVGLDYRNFVAVSEDLIRSRDSSLLVGNYQRIRDSIGWRPATSFEDMIRDMVDYDIQRLKGNKE